MYDINLRVFITDVECAYCVVQFEPQNIIQVDLYL